ncbi:hypothetical protein F5878DRAFT_659360 [Lentinula raphanica]|uniref:Uncharacterized protein n=1 Tax=Lentinula raphanica TaxID=153919 RepID=A0AA38PCN6_9AGAR|nr:hypothetical protein F5878DRAFT_659360 [Lentinula raphanica]
MSPASRLSLHLGRAVQRTQTNTRYLHIKNINGGLQSIVAPGHVHEGGHLPFSYRRKPAFLGKFAAFCTAGFTIPFAAVLYVITIITCDLHANLSHLRYKKAPQA